MIISKDYSIMMLDSKDEAIHHQKLIKLLKISNTELKRVTMLLDQHTSLLTRYMLTNYSKSLIKDIADIKQAIRQ